MSTGPGGTDPQNPIIPAGLFREMVEHAADVIALLDSSGAIVYTNPSAQTQFGYSPTDLIGTSVFDHLHPDDQHLAINAFATLMDQGDHDRILLRFRDKQGAWRRVEVLGTPYTSDADNGMVLNVRDVTESQALVEQMERSEALFRAAFNASGSICCITLLETGKFIDVNDAWVRATGWSREEALGRTAIELNIWGAPRSRDRVIETILQEGSLRQFPAEITRKDGQTRSLLIDAEVVLIEGERRMFITAMDITERELMEEQLRQSQRMEAVGQLTGGVAHDFNNMLTVILGHIGLARHGQYAPEVIQRSLVAIEEAAERGAELIRQLMVFSRRQTLHPKVTNVAATLKSMETLIAGTLGGEISIEMDTSGAATACCNLDQGLLENAILNLAINARDALQDGGTLTLRASMVCLPGDLPVTVNQALMPGDYILLDVIDDGIGMDADTAARAFEPFFTTKAPGRGTGLGLSMVFGFVKQSGGHINITSAPGKGTRVSLFLPVTGQSEDAHEENAGPTRNLSGKRILLVEDNAELRAMLVELLTSLGCVVVESDGDNIEAVLAAGPEAPDLLLSDVILPGALRGPDVARRVQQQYPAVRTLFMSGYPRERFSSEAIVDQQNLLQKPFAEQDLVERLSLLLAPDQNS